jgi:hypothetical protein
MQEWVYSGVRKGKQMRTCKVDGCKRKTHRRRYCRLHYRRLFTKPDTKPCLLRSDSLKRVNLDNIAVGWLEAILERLP